MRQLTEAFDLEFTDSNKGQGWVFGRPVGIGPDQWPRSRITGIPMAHIWTVLVPEAYRVKSKDLVAISFFQADDYVASRTEGVEEMIDDPQNQNQTPTDFWSSLRRYALARHPHEIFFKDDIGGGWALLWLTQEEFDSLPTSLPDKDSSLPPNYELDEFNGGGCFTHDKPARFIEQVKRQDDPNIGKPLNEYPSEDDPDPYVTMYSKQGDLMGLERFSVKNHFGGTANPIQAMPEFSPFYIEFEENFGGANMGGGNGQIDLLNDQFDWACG